MIAEDDAAMALLRAILDMFGRAAGSAGRIHRTGWRHDAGAVFCPVTDLNRQRGIIAWINT